MKQAADAKIRSRIEGMIELGASFTEARDMIQVAPGSVKKEIKETKDNNTFTIDPATIAAIGNVLTPVISALTERKRTEEILATALANALNNKSEARNG